MGKKESSPAIRAGAFTLLIALATALPVAIAADKPGKTGRPDPAAKQNQATAGQQTVAKQAFAASDRNQDGFLSGAELNQAVGLVRKELQRVYMTTPPTLEALEKQQDAKTQKVNDRIAAKKKQEPDKTPPKPKPDATGKLAAKDPTAALKLDKDGDGKVNADEFTNIVALLDQMTYRQRWGKNPPAQKAASKSNGPSK